MDHINALESEQSGIAADDAPLVTVGDRIRDRRFIEQYKKAAFKKGFQFLNDLGCLSDRRHKFSEIELLDIELLRDRLSDIYKKAGGNK
jgi:hypothetical protein